MDYYKILGVETNATQVVINRAYRKLSLQFNPEKNVHEGGFYIKMFNQIQEAYTILGDEEKRKDYDVENGYLEADFYKIVKFEINKSEVRTDDIVLISWETVGEGSVRLEDFGLLKKGAGELAYQIPNNKNAKIQFTLNLLDKDGFIADTKKCEIHNISYQENQKKIIEQEFFEVCDDDDKRLSSDSESHYSSAYSRDKNNFSNDAIYTTGSRIGRLDFLGRTILWGLLFVFLIITFDSSDFLIGLVSLLNIVVFFSVANKRLHDMNYSGLYLLFLLIPFGNLILLFFLFFMPGTDGPNKYGIRK